ncbi:MAG: beta-ketoacyl-[acyl-carrier-protein] synthase family protein [Desulforhopalus sp.]|nr:beta-ketoacyl-[acyl-carrier-protein] synthase family protein [Desulforhopalus sp.]
MDLKKVVVTGLGTVNATAGNVAEFYRALRTGRCGIGPVSVFDATDFRTQTGGEVKDFRPAAMLPRGFSLKRLSRSDAMAMVAAIEALNDAGLFPLPAGLLPKIGVVIGGGAGGMLECEAVYRDYLHGAGKMPAYSAFSSFGCASSADQIAIQLELMGPKTTFMTACSSGATAIGYARDLVQTGAAKAIICGGTEPLCRITYSAFNSLQAVDPQYCKPFDKNRQGLSLGEGAGIMILEEYTHAVQRGARIYGEVLGYGVSCDAHHMTSPDPEGGGAALAMARALEDAGVGPEAVDYINAHGTGTPANDKIETKAIKHLLGDRAYQVPVSSSKSMTGHTLGAAGAIEGVVSLLALYHAFIPPTIHSTVPDPDCDLDYVTEGARDAALRVVLSNSFAFGGNNTALVFGRFSGNGCGHE